jgi:hypothetical protein
MKPFVFEASSVAELLNGARSLCEDGQVMNLVLSLEAVLPLSSDAVLVTYREQAELWQSNPRPPSLHISHGEFMHAHGDPFDYITRELKDKPTSNRAVISLINSEPIIASGDDALPSFMLVQAGFELDERKVLYLSAYYRALEVSQFLPINLAEMALIAEKLQSRIPSISTVNLTIHAFRAHLIENFRTLTRSGIDVIGVDAIHKLVVSNDRARIADLLIEKSAPESIVEDQGLANLRDEAESARWGRPILDLLDQAIVLVTRLKVARKNGSHEDSIALLQHTLMRTLVEGAALVRSEMNGASHGTS